MCAWIEFWEMNNCFLVNSQWLKTEQSQYLLWVELCSPKNYVEPLEPVNMTLLINTDFKDKIR